jgi:hypothetical protein
MILLRLARSAEVRGGLLLLALPLLLLLTLPNMLLQAGSLDPYVYTGYIHHYGDLLQRYGRTYYSTRIAFIFPDIAFVRLLGDEWGYLAIRYVVLTAGTAAIYRIARRFYSTNVAVIVAIFFLFSPWTVRSVAWDHYDGFASIYILIALYFLLSPKRYVFLASAFAGCAFALAVNCNMFLLAIGGLFFPSWLILQKERGWGPVLVSLTWILVGFTATETMLGVVSWFYFPQFGLFIESAALTEAMAMLHGQASNWYVPLWPYLSSGYYHPLVVGFVELMILLYIFACYFRGIQIRRKTLTTAAATYLGLLIIFFLILHFVLRGPFLTLIYYQSYFIPAFYLVITVLIGETLMRSPQTIQRAIILGVVAIHIGLWIAVRFDLPVASHLPFVVFLGFALAIIAAVTSSQAAMAAISISIFCVLSPFAFYSAGRVGLWPWSPMVTRVPASISLLDYARIQSSARAVLEKDVYGGAIFLGDSISKLSPTLGPVGFWYGTEDEDVYLNSIQSMYLWGYSRVFPAESGGMPAMNGEVRKAIQDKRFLVLLGRTEAELKAGLGALRASKLVYSILEEKIYAGKQWGYQMLILEIPRQRRDTGAVIAQIPLSALEPAGGQVSRSGEGVAIVSPSTPWSYAALAPVPADTREANEPLLLHLRMKVESGSMGISVAYVGNDSKLMNEITVGQSSIINDEYVEIPTPASAGTVIIRNAADFQVGRATILSMEIVKLGELRGN